MRGRGIKAATLVVAAVTGFGGAAAVSALAAPGVPVAHGFGQGDGLTRYVVTAAAGRSTPDLLAALEHVPGVANAQVLHDGSTLVATRDLPPQALRAVPGVADVSFSPQVAVLADTVPDPYWSTYGYNLKNTGSNSYDPGTAGYDVDAPDGWAGGTGAGMVVADIDTGYYSAHEDLQGALWTNPRESCSAPTDTDGDGHVGDCHGWNFTTNTNDVDNGSGGEHGTSTAGVIGERLGNGKGSAGVAPSVQIMPLTVGSGGNIDMNLAIEAIYYAVDHGANVINASWGGGLDPATLARLQAAIGYADQHGVLFVAAAGNDSGDRDTSLLYPASLGGDGAGSLENVITVGNMNPDGTINSTSAYGARTVDLFAPGDLVFTTWNNDGGQPYMLVSGTSIAAPHVAAAAALYRAKMPTATAAQIKAAILADAQHEAAFAGKSVSGGMLSLARLGGVATGTVSYAFSAMTQPVGSVSPTIDVSGSSGAGDYSVRIGLGMRYQGQTWGLSGATLTLDGVPATTNDDGEATFDLGQQSDVGPRQLVPTVQLAAGQYALTVQTYKDGVPLGETYAAPLTVGAASSTSPASGAAGSDPSGSAGSGSSGSGPSGSPGSGSPGSGSPGTGSPGTGSSDPGSTGSGASGSGSGSGSGAGSGSGGTGGGAPNGDTNVSSAAPDAGGPGGSGTQASSPAGSGDAGSGTGGSTGTGTGPGSAGAAGSGGGGSAAVGGLGGEQDYPPTGVFGLTSISPARVGTSGGAAVTVTGTAVPANPRVLIGGTDVATVTSSGPTSVTFTAPALAAGTYDVTLFDATGQQSSTLHGALTYVAVSGSDAGPAGTGTGTGTGDPGASSGSAGTGSGTGSTGSPSTGTGSPGTGSSTGGSGTGGSGSGSGSGGPGSGSSAPVSVTGPNGEHLVRSGRYASLTDSFWNAGCAGSCGGTVVEAA